MNKSIRQYFFDYPISIIPLEMLYRNEKCSLDKTWILCPHSLMTFKYFPVVKIVSAAFARKLGISFLRL